MTSGWIAIGALALALAVVVYLWLQERRKRQGSLVDSARDLARTNVEKAERETTEELERRHAEERASLEEAHRKAEEAANDGGNLTDYLRDRGAGSD